MICISCIAVIIFSITGYDFISWLIGNKNIFNVIIDLAVMFCTIGVIISTALCLRKLNRGE